MIRTIGSAVALAAALSMAVSGCAVGQVRKDANNHYEEAKETAERLMNARESARMPVAGPIVTDAPYVDVTPISRVEREPLAFSRIVTFNTTGDVSMHVFAQRIEGMTGVKVRYQSDMVRSGSGAAQSMLPASTAPLVVNGITMPAVDATVGVPASANDGAPGVRLNYSGSLRGLFEQVSEQTGAHWKWDATRQVVDFYHYETESFRVAAVQGEGKTSFEIGGAQNSASGENALRLADTEASHETRGSLWADIDSTLSKLVGPQGVYQVNQSGGMVVVRAQPDHMQMVRDYFGTLNEALSRQVDIEVTVYRVQVNDRDFKGVSWDALFQNLLSDARYKVRLSNIRPDVVSENASSAVVRFPPVNSDGSPHRWGNTQFFLDALTTLGRASVVQSTSVLTASNRAAAAKFVRRNTYLAETVPTYASGGGTSMGTGAGLTPGSVETGLNLYLLPHVQDDGKRMVLQAMVSISTLDAMESYSSGEQSIQLPQVSSREFSREAWLTSGETLVLTGFSQIEAGNQSKSPFGRLWALGGERTISNGQELLVIAITPVVSAARSQI